MGCIIFTENCNVATFLEYQGVLQCVLASCDPFDNCTWSIYNGALTARVDREFEDGDATTRPDVSTAAVGNETTTAGSEVSGETSPLTASDRPPQAAGMTTDMTQPVTADETTGPEAGGPPVVDGNGTSKEYDMDELEEEETEDIEKQEQQFINWLDKMFENGTAEDATSALSDGDESDFHPTGGQDRNSAEDRRPTASSPDARESYRQAGENTDHIDDNSSSFANPSSNVQALFDRPTMLFVACTAAVLLLALAVFVFWRIVDRRERARYTPLNEGFVATYND